MKITTFKAINKSLNKLQVQIFTEKRQLELCQRFMTKSQFLNRSKFLANLEKSHLHLSSFIMQKIQHYEAIHCNNQNSK